MPEKLSDIFVKQHGIYENHEKIETGELRFRLCGPDGSSYIRCENPGGELWENSHCHQTIQEMVIVQSGRIIFAEYRDGRACFRELSAGEYALTVPFVPHNICMEAEAVIHTVKFGDCSQNDWIPSPELDEATRLLSYQEARAFCLENK